MQAIFSGEETVDSRRNEERLGQLIHYYRNDGICFRAFWGVVTQWFLRQWHGEHDKRGGDEADDDCDDDDND